MTEPPPDPFGALLEITPAALRPLMTTLRALVLAVDPAAVEVVRMGDRAATYGLGTRKMSEGYAYLMPQSGWVNLGFYRGASLADPEALLEGTGRAMRHVKVHPGGGVDAVALRALLTAARAERRAALGG